jgi:hypothetical protein
MMLWSFLNLDKMALSLLLLLLLLLLLRLSKRATDRNG